LNNNKIKAVVSFNYLGREIVTNGSIEEDITERIKDAGKLHQLLQEAFWK
jgi:hypothetical protein